MRDAWRLAVGTFTALPVAPPAHVDRPVLGRAMLLAPLTAAPAALVWLGLGTWLTAVIDDAGWDDLDAAAAAVRQEVDRLVESLCAATVPVVVVTNEVGWSLVATTASGRLFQDELGRLNALVSRVAAHAHLVVAGRVLDLGDAPVVPWQPRSRTLDA